MSVHTQYIDLYSIKCWEGGGGGGVEGTQEHDPPGLLHLYFNKNSHLTIIVGQLQRCISQDFLSTAFITDNYNTLLLQTFCNLQ